MVSEDSKSKTQSYMADILVTLIEEMDVVDSQVLDIVMEHLLPNKKVNGGTQADIICTV